MNEYSIDKTIEEGSKEKSKQNVVNTVGSYIIDIVSNEGNIPYGIDTMVFQSGEIVWTRSNRGPIHTQNVNLKNLKNNNKSKKVMCRIIQDVYSNQTGENVGLKSILERHESLVEEMLTDYISYYKKEFKK